MYENELIKKNDNQLSAILVAVCTTGDDTSEEFVHMMEETQELISACEMDTVRWVTQCLASPNPGTYIGSGKLMELAQLVELFEADCVVFADNLSPAQLKNIADGVEAEVLDRTSLILEIFSRRAKTREARLQVELANLQYMLPRLVGMRKNLGRQGGASGALSNKGSGEKQIDLDKRRIERRITELRRDLAEVEHNREVQRKARAKGNTPQVALVGYTNAGKSTIMNRLVGMSGAEEEKRVLEKDMLFATLDTTIRRIETGDKKDFLLSDTVGFISNLPHDLVRAFHSTLEEVCFADLLLLVVDVSDPHFVDQLKVTEDTLRTLNADTIPRIYVMNKVDRILEGVAEENELGRIMSFKPGTVIGGDRIYLSASKGEGITKLLEMIRNQIYGNNEILKILIPYTEGNVVGMIRSGARVILEDYRENGTYMEIDCPKHLAGALKNNKSLTFM